MKKKICINAINAKSYGITNYTIQLINNLQANFSDLFEITIFTSSDVSDRYRELDSGCHIIVVHANNAIEKTLYSNLIFPFKLLQYDLVHSVANLGLLITPTAQVITIHDTYEMTSAERFSAKKRVYMRGVISWSGIFAKKIITVSQNTAKDVIHYYPFLKKKVRPIYSGCNYPILSNDKIQKEKKSYFLFVGTIEPGKNLQTLLKAMQQLDKKYSMTLKVVGAKEWRQSEEICRDLPESVEFLGKVSNEELEKLFQNATALIFPSLYEGFGFPVIEAMANGCPVIAANNSAIPEAGGASAYYFEATNVDQLLQQMEKVISMVRSDEIEEVMKNGLNQSRKFDWLETANQVKEVYCSILNK